VLALELYLPGSALTIFNVDSNDAFICLIFATPFYLTLYMYLDNVLPNTFGIRQHPLFCLKRRQPSMIDDDAFRADSNIKIQRLTKCYGSFKAISELTLDVRHNEVLCLLGHNGAGKTTAINMLTGMITPSSGDAMILGNSLVTSINRVRSSIGFCQQEDVLFQ
jgi:ATP-binding cassette subfamily A (ABC1) protein 3